MSSTKAWLILAHGPKVESNAPTGYFAAFDDPAEALKQVKAHIGVGDDDERHSFTSPSPISAETISALGLVEGQVRAI